MRILIVCSLFLQHLLHAISAHVPLLAEDIVPCAVLFFLFEDRSSFVFPGIKLAKIGY
ncbi:hypothetical protein E6C60_3803 [Paenibacillus algicola]|uniref:Uncharacterized protein n=1 Tax=Paenibacillus algicola TaxID=2565926 RepID=A0A4P8XPD7_9BACL|nr:hypothetical protein E6C60_3803 [Paenibacillus algicola]